MKKRKKVMTRAMMKMKPEIRKRKRKLMILKKMLVRKKIKRKREKMKKQKKAEKRKALVDNLLDPNAAGPSKKSRMDSFAPSVGQPQLTGGSTTGAESIFEEDVRRYL